MAVARGCADASTLRDGAKKVKINNQPKMAVMVAETSEDVFM